MDIVAQQLCENLDPGRRVQNMDDYRLTIVGAKTILRDAAVEIPRYGLALSPWDNWRENRNPDWWRAYNSVKHQRHERYSEANLKNTLNSVCGYFCSYSSCIGSGQRRENLCRIPLCSGWGYPSKQIECSGAKPAISRICSIISKDIMVRNIRDLVGANFLFPF